MTKSRYIMIGGFLGAGKTTAINAFARFLDERSLKVGLITNDQGSGLVDSALGRRSGRFPVEEIAGGCFCCRFNSLTEAASRLTEATAPDVFLAEPVGSCTDLVATVSLPLKKIYGESYAVAPLSVVVDPIRALRVLGFDPDGRRFSENVLYIYGKQLEEAEIIVINKIDLVSDEQRQTLRTALAATYPDARLVEVSAREGTGLAAWFETALAEEIDVPRFLEIDYARYGQGEALLGWLNTTVAIGDPDEEYDGNALLRSLAAALRTSLDASGLEVAHLKMTLAPTGAPMELAAINLVRTDAQPELSHTLVDPLDSPAELLLNIRAEADPGSLQDAVTRALDEILSTSHGLAFTIPHSEHFRPGQPTPTHRLTTAT
ncbi:GTP-binding protein [soil metagenome]